MKKMMTAALVLLTFGAFAQKQSTTHGTVAIKSSSPATDVEATSHKLRGAFDANTREFSFIIDMTTLDFPNDEMENHYNEKYLQTDKAENRNSTFKGKILGTEDFTKDGTHKLVAQGKLTCHNVTKDYNIIVVFTVVNGVVTATAEFGLPLKDHNIEVPKLVFAKIGEIINVKIAAEFVPMPAKK